MLEKVGDVTVAPAISNRDRLVERMQLLAMRDRGAFDLIMELVRLLAIVSPLLSSDLQSLSEIPTNIS